MSVVSLVATAATQTVPAIGQFQSFQIQLRDSHGRNDWHSYLTTAKQMSEFLNESPDSLLEIARADVHIGDYKAAFHELDQSIQMGQSYDLIATSPEFASLRQGAEFKTIQSRMAANRTLISLASTAFPLSDPGLLAEDVDYDPRSKRLFITSVLEKKIISTDMSGRSSDFARAPDSWPMLAIKVDSSHRALWATEIAMKGFKDVSASDWGRSALLCYDLESGKLLRRIEGPRPSDLGDIVLTNDGDVIASDGDGGGVYRVTSNGAKLERLDNGDFISPQTPAICPDGKHIFVPDYARGIGVLEIATRQVHWLSMEKKYALNGIDGLYFDQGQLIAVQNGTSPERVVAFTLDKSLSRIDSELIIDRSSKTLGDPTHGVIIGKIFYYIANSGWNAIDDQGIVKAGMTPTVPLIMRLEIAVR